MKIRIARPSLVVDISGLDLRGVANREGKLHIGALTTWDELLHSPELGAPALAALAECAARIGDLQVRNRGTVGGSLAHADPASDFPAVLLALGAELGLRSADGDRAVAAKDFVLGPFLTQLSRQELITDVVVPVPNPGSGSAYVSVEHPASGFALAGAAALVTEDGGRTIAVTGVAAHAFLVQDGSAFAGADVLDDRYATAEYRRHVAEVVVRRAVEHAEERRKEDR